MLWQQERWKVPAEKRIRRVTYQHIRLGLEGQPHDVVALNVRLRTVSSSCNRMDILSHALWAGAAGEVMRRRGLMSGRMLAATIVLGAAPDIAALTPMAAWSTFQPHGLSLFSAYVEATPGTEPATPPIVHLLSHHAHCVMHSVVIAGLVTLLTWWIRPRLLPVLIGWWLHIGLDIPTHSNDYYAVPFLYPITYWGINGVAWTNPWVLGTDYVALVIAYGALLLTRRKTIRPNHGEDVWEHR